MNGFNDDFLYFDRCVFERAECSSDDKRSLFPLAERIVQYLAEARRDGILVLEKHLPEMTPPVLRKGLALAVDGTDPKIISRALYYDTLTDGAAGRELLERLLACEGVQAIQRGLHPVEVAALLAPYFGVDLMDEAEARLHLGRDELRRRVDAAIAVLPDRPAREPGTLLEDIIPRLYDHGVYCLVRSDQFRALYHSDVELALAFASGPVRRRILEIMPLRQGLIILDSSMLRHYLNPEQPHWISADEFPKWKERLAARAGKTQATIVEIVNKLAASGWLIVQKD